MAGYFHVGGGERTDWKVKVSAGKLGQACNERILYHRGRASWWLKEWEAAEKELRASGISLRHQEVTGGTRTEARLDDSMAARIAECENKAKSHRKSVDTFRAYAAFFNLAGAMNFEVNADDVLYFNLEQADPEGEQ